MNKLIPRFAALVALAAAVSLAFLALATPSRAERTRVSGTLTLQDGDELRSVDVTMSAAQMLALYATPRTLVQAPGAGYALIFQGAVVFVDYNSAAYAGIAAGEDLSVKYTDASGLEVGALEATGFLDATADALRWVPQKAVAGITPVANSPLVLHMLTGEITTGDSPVKLRVYYRRVPAVL